MATIVISGWGQQKFINLPTLYGRFYYIDYASLKKTETSAHKFIYMLSKSLTFIDSPGCEVSHLCHYSLCVNSDHLILEHKSINLGRNACKNYRKCSQQHIPHCIF